MFKESKRLTIKSNSSSLLLLRRSHIGSIADLIPTFAKCCAAKIADSPSFVTAFRRKGFCPVTLTLFFKKASFSE
ncbi:hypothetical protein [Hyella patelloides]|uniref:hypothetical protein n=1 Tax=Hyella patelloides TaxID=1982969 RepID=UPI0011AABDFE|nr:hypothetical protein [Hyella patelloides]